eukprot:CAMPEP_0119041514 /NCGR_PEP_ID=MMETSP1177-20130426/12512_1 /TAXON_ID=2985 /ORGANISM="Ochromonas sp, Strain CCMP1899" /LENGTH=84 /DNA_ID=CAMNT_0007007633 /DNA_START=162 /DNA_END=416 /DNA_ORIENTATION=+
MTRSIPTVLFAEPEPPRYLKEGDGEEELKKRELSDTMKGKVMKEIQDNAGDPNFSQGPITGNPILIISLIIAGLALLSKVQGYI